jgi:hypothetical protein
LQLVQTPFQNAFPVVAMAALDFGDRELNSTVSMVRMIAHGSPGRTVRDVAILSRATILSCRPAVGFRSIVTAAAAKIARKPPKVARAVSLQP